MSPGAKSFRRRRKMRSGSFSTVSNPLRVQETKRRRSRRRYGSSQGLRMPAGALKYFGARPVTWVMVDCARPNSAITPAGGRKANEFG